MWHLLHNKPIGLHHFIYLHHIFLFVQIVFYLYYLPIYTPYVSSIISYVYFSSIHHCQPPQKILWRRDLITYLDQHEVKESWSIVVQIDLITYFSTHALPFIYTIIIIIKMDINICISAFLLCFNCIFTLSHLFISIFCK